MTTTKILHKYKNGNCNVELYSDGTKIRTFPKNPLPIFPESIDLKITNMCNGGCRFCHEESTKNGLHADPGTIVSALKDLPKGTEIAVGGGAPLDHPDIFELLLWMKMQGLIANITVRNSTAVYESTIIKKLQKEKMIHGLGVSYSNLRDMHTDKQMTRLPYNDNTVLHVIVGVTHPQDLLKYGKKYKTLVLGFKNFGRGKKHYKNAEKNFREWRFWIPTIMRTCKLISFDNLALEQLKIKDKITEKAWESFYMGDDGQFTMYIDAVKKQFAKSSISSRHKINNLNIKEMFKQVRSEA